MKRILATVCAGICLTGCTMQTLPGKTRNRMCGSFVADVTMTNAESETKATLTRYGLDAWCVVFNEPAALSGVQLDFLDDEVKASYKGLEFSVPQSAQALKTELSGLMEVVDNMSAQAELDGRTEEGQVICEGESETGSYALCCAEDGMPLSFSLPSYGLVVTFDSFAEQEINLSTQTETIPKTYPIEEPTDTQSAPGEANEEVPLEQAAQAEPEQPVQAEPDGIQGE